MDDKFPQLAPLALDLLTSHHQKLT